ncbi:MAG TPA: hypothetical protein VGM89_18200 [Puia sp.]
MPPKLWKYYLRATLIPLPNSVVAAILLLLIDSRWGFMHELSVQAKAEAKELGWVFVGIAIGNGAVFAALTTTIFLNGLEKIRTRPFLRLLAWSLLPLIWLVYVILFANDSDLVVGADLDMQLLVGTLTLPYLVANPWTFIKYSRALRNSTASAPGDPQPSPPATPGAPGY